VTRVAPKVIGMAGGVGAGKSSVARFFEEMGAVVIDADRLGHEVLEEEEVRRSLRRRWGDAVFGEHGRVDRRRVASLVFSDEAARTFLNGLTHPRIRERIEQLIEGCRSEAATPLVVLDAPLIYEGGLEGWCEAIVFVEADRHVREARTSAQRQWDADELARRESAQTSPDAKQRRADFVISNNGAPEETRRQSRAVFRAILGVAPDSGP